MLKNMDYSEQGYPESRFASAVDEDLNCPICLNILREPLQCEMNEHYFCSVCIKRHLRNTPRCPSCLEDLSLETLKKPSRYLTKQLGSLMMNCDHESRGCSEFVKLEDLPRHLQHCGYAPVPCQNEGCGEVLNKQDLILHETEICRRRRISCHDCATTKKEIRELKVSFEEFKAKKEILISDEASRTREEIQIAIGDLKFVFNELVKKEISELKICFEEFKAKKEISDEASRKEIGDLKVVLGELVKNEVLKAKEICEVKISLEELKKQVGHTFDSKIGIADKPCKSPANENTIVVIGGYNNEIGHLASTEMYVWSEKKWLPLPDTTQPRFGSSAVVFENQILVTGGEIDDDTLTNSIEVIYVDRKPMQWFNHPVKLPHLSCGHQCIVYKDHLIVIDDKDGHIYKVSLRPPYTHKLLSTMPTSRIYYRAELIGDKIVIIGGTSQDVDSVMEQSVVLFDITTCKCHEIFQLGSGVHSMASVTWLYLG